MYLENDITGEIGFFLSYQPGWSPANSEEPPVPQAEIDIFLLKIAKNQKLPDLKNDLNDFLMTGYIYDGHTFLLNDKTTENIRLKFRCSAANPDRYKFYDFTEDPKDAVLVNFTDLAGFTTFSEAVQDEKDRVMVKYNAYKVQIAACVTVAEVNAIVIDFSV